MGTRKLLICLLSLCCVIPLLNAQDIHYSQFYNSPLTLNPALTGKINGSYRVAINYRNQWYGVINGHSPFVTPSASFEMPFIIGKDAVGAGLLILNDRTGGGRLNSFTAMASGAYHKALGSNHSLSLGVQVGFVQKRLDVDHLEFASQFVDNEFNHNLPSGENLTGGTASFADLNAGLMWNGRFGSKFSGYAGFSGFHLNKPKETFLIDGSLRVPVRLVAHGGFAVQVNERFSILPSVIYMNMAKVTELNLGTSFGIHFPKDAAFYLGGYYRLDDAAIAYTAVEWKNARIGFSYDFTTSSLKESSKTTNRPTGSVEFSIIYVGKIIPLPDVKPVLFCPRF